MPLSDEERQKLYEEEKAREEIREQLRRERREEGRSDEAPRLTKSTEDKVMFGVAGGIAEHFKVDSMLVRLGFIVLCFVDGLGLLLYFGLALILPPRSNYGPNLIGIMAISIIVVVLLGLMSFTVSVFRFLF